MAAAWLARAPAVDLVLAVLLTVVTVLGGGIRLRSYARVALAPLGFLTASCLTMLVSVVPVDGGMQWRLAPELLPQLLGVACRAAALCAALFLLVLTTPLGDLLGLLRRLHVPAVLLDLMVVAYRMQSVLRECFADGLTAQRARLGHAGGRQRLRSVSLLIGQLAVQCWARASALQAAADARNLDGPLRFLPARFPHWRRECLVAGLCGLALMLGAAA